MSDSDPQSGVGEIEPGKRLVRADDRGLSLGERLAARFYQMTWRTPFHAFRLNGRYPLKLLAVPQDPLAGNVAAGRAFAEGFVQLGLSRAALGDIEGSADAVAPALIMHCHRFAWLRDVAAAFNRAQAATIAEPIVRAWLERNGAHVGDAAWAPETVGWRTLFWASHAPAILSSTDVVYRSSVLNTFARGARHLDRSADRASVGLPRIVAWAGIVAAGLLIPGGDPRRQFGEAGLERAVKAGMSDDGGVITRVPTAQLELIELLAMLRAVYHVRNVELPQTLQSALDGAVAALLGVAMGDGGLASWQGGGPVPQDQVQSIVAASGVRTRPLRQARDWGYQRLMSGATVVVADMAPPPPSRLSRGGCASTLAFELSDGDRRLIVNCGNGPDGSTIPVELRRALRTTAAHSTLTLGDTNSTAINADGTLGAGVASVEVDRQELEGGSRIDATHDGYARRFGLIHKRTLALSAGGRELRGEDALLPGPRRRKARDVPFAIRFHLAPGVEVTPTADGLAALLRIDHGPLWQFRCRGGTLTIEDSLWVDADGRPRPTQQFVIEGVSPPGGTSVGWLLKRAG